MNGYSKTCLWTDEFNTDGAPDATKWGYDIGGNGWGNNELQYYTDGLNSSVSRGILKIVAKKENFLQKLYFCQEWLQKTKAIGYMEDLK